MNLFKTGSLVEDALLDAPNPKPSAADKSRFGKIASIYTAFSREFAEFSLDLCIESGCRTIVDPFSGMGTLAEAARSRPVNLKFSDISPFAILSGTLRAASQAKIEASIALLESLVDQVNAKDESEFYSCLIGLIFNTNDASIDSILTNPLRQRNVEASLMMYLSALSRIHLHKSFTGSNPTWVRSPDEAADAGATRAAIESTLEMVREYTKTLTKIHPRNRTVATWSSIENLKMPEGKVDAIVTSPPYANRTDYIRHYQPASELLLSATDRDERAIRAAQIGTPLIRSAEDLAVTMPSQVKSVLEQVRTHPSYASERYYYKGFLYYFSDMSNALLAMRAWLVDKGILIMVVQDTYYKELSIPSVSMLIELATSHGFVLVGRRDWRVQRRLSQLSPHSRMSMPNRAPNESVIVFSK